MNITQFFSKDSKNAGYMRYDYHHAHGTIYSRYTRPSQAKIQAWVNIVDAYNLDGGVHHCVIKGKEHIIQYLGDVKMANAGCQFFSTIASFKDFDDDTIYLIKETHANTYMCEL